MLDLDRRRLLTRHFVVKFLQTSRSSFLAKGHTIATSLSLLIEFCYLCNEFHFSRVLRPLPIKFGSVLLLIVMALALL